MRTIWNKQKTYPQDCHLTFCRQHRFCPDTTVLHFLIPQGILKYHGFRIGSKRRIPVLISESNNSLTSQRRWPYANRLLTLDLHTNNMKQTVTYSREFLLNIRRQHRCPPDTTVLYSLKSHGILKYRGCRGGIKRRIPILISNRNNNLLNQPKRQYANRTLTVIPIFHEISAGNKTNSGLFPVPKCLFLNICSVKNQKTRSLHLQH